MYKCKNDINPAFVGDLFTSHDPHPPLSNTPTPTPIFSDKWWKIWTTYCEY